MTGKSINLFLMDGDPNGRIKCTLANWTGVAYKIPRTMLEKAKNISYLQQTGVYLLFGTSNETSNPIVYIGQAGIRKNGQGILNRWEEHKRNSNKDWWMEAVALTTSNNSFGATEISYLENRFRNMAIKAERYEVMNGNDPTHGNLTEEKESEMEEFISYARLVIGALGYKVFEPLIASKDEVNHQDALNDEPVLLSRRRSANAKAKRTSEGFVLLRGSKISEGYVKSAPRWVHELREKNAAFIQTDGTITRDLLFSSPSAAAAFVAGGSANGLIEWKTEDGRTLKELEAES
ncbi:MAG: GIY-YIG nuclease family protein [Peptoniphilus sp.]|nr:GIY-YIG nuclease family protein [Peptoniphilus sp.]MDY3118670.1 GIY-YIG nuclease family protein [Peptoniphilus sp.]